MHRLFDRLLAVSERLGVAPGWDRRLAARLDANARDLVEQRFTWRACAERFLAAYETL